MSANYKQLSKFAKDIERLNQSQKEEFLRACCKELAARLLSDVINNTTADTGTLRRGWLAATHEEVASGRGKVNRGDINAWCDKVEIKKQGNTYILDIINPVTYAPYYEYGHRTPSGTGWVEGHFPLTIAEAHLNTVTDGILAKRLRRFIKEAFGE